MYRLTGIAFGAGGFGGHRSQRGTGFGVVVVLGDRIENVEAVGDVIADDRCPRKMPRRKVGRRALDDDPRFDAKASRISS